MVRPIRHYFDSAQPGGSGSTCSIQPRTESHQAKRTLNVELFIC